jgi:hypothetical protein
MGMPYPTPPDAASIYSGIPFRGSRGNYTDEEMAAGGRWLDFDSASQVGLDRIEASMSRLIGGGGRSGGDGGSGRAQSHAPDEEAAAVLGASAGPNGLSAAVTGNGDDGVCDAPSLSGTGVVSHAGSTVNVDLNQMVGSGFHTQPWSADAKIQHPIRKLVESALDKALRAAPHGAAESFEVSRDDVNGAPDQSHVGHRDDGQSHERISPPGSGTPGLDATSPMFKSSRWPNIRRNPYHLAFRARSASMLRSLHLTAAV